MPSSTPYSTWTHEEPINFTSLCITVRVTSPLSLVFFRLTQFSPFIDWYSASRMNNASWWVMVATTLLVRESGVRYGRSHSAPNLIETIGMAILPVIAVSIFFRLPADFETVKFKPGWISSR
jgi:hypothetical protein